jgi:hypothetical protein
MQIRKQIEKWRWKTFMLLFALFLILYNGFILLSALVDDDPSYQGSRVSFWLLNGILLPLILSIAITFTVRNAMLYISDIHTIQDFTPKLKQHILKKGFTLYRESPQEIHFRPSSVFYRMLRSWFGTEDLKVTSADEIVVEGPVRKISEIEDVLTWNQDFKA